MNKTLGILARTGAWLLLCFAVGWTLQYLTAGFGNPMDPHYWLYKYRSLESGWMPIGTILTGGAIVRLFGAELLPLRIAGWVCASLAILLPYLCLLDREQRRANIHWLAVAFALMNYGAYQEFSPGTLTVLLLSLVWVLLVRYMRAERRWLWAVGLGLAAGLAIAVRFPNVLVLLPVGAAMLTTCGVRNGRAWAETAVMLAACALAAGAVYGIGYLYVTPAYIDPALNSTHQLGRMIDGLWQKGAMLAGCALLWLGLYAIGRIARDRMPQSWQPWGMIGAGVAGGAVVGYYVTFVPEVIQWYNFDVTYLISVLCLLWALSGRRNHLLWGAAVLAVASLGTDTGWLKLFPAVLCLIPVAAPDHEADMRRFAWPVMIGLAATVMIRFSVNSVGQCNLRYADTQATLSPYNHIRITADENRWIEQVKADYDSLSTQGAVLAVGRRMHLMRSLTGCDAARYNEFWWNIYDSVYTAKYTPLIREERPIVFCFHSPGFQGTRYRAWHSAFEEMLRAEGYTEIDRRRYKYMIYVPAAGDDGSAE